MKTKTVLCILDGFGVAESTEQNAISLANAAFLHKMLKSSNCARLNASGSAVGLPEGQMGNSEVGHMTIGTGRISKQSLSAIDDEIADGTFFYNEALQSIKSEIVHIIGLYSSGGVHSSGKHILKLAQMYSENGKTVYLHLFSDGRDVPPNSFLREITDLCHSLKYLNNTYVSTICGRYFAMDRDLRWNRTDIAFNLIKYGIGEDILHTNENQKNIDDVINALNRAILTKYTNNENDEFMQALKIGNTPILQATDGILFANFRADRIRQLALKLIEDRILLHMNELTISTTKEKDLLQMSDSYTVMNKHKYFYQKQENDSKITEQIDNSIQSYIKHIVLLSKQITKPFNLNIVSMTQYFHDNEHEIADMFKVAFSKFSPTNSFGEVIAKLDKTQIRIAETEKYAHVTYFFNGGTNIAFEGEHRMLVPSPHVATYNEKPEMSSTEVKNATIKAIQESYDLIVVNFANCDMVGHTGDLQATIKAVEAVNIALEEIKNHLTTEYYLAITADHGNAEEMIDKNNLQHTQHTLNPVPFYIIDSFGNEIKLHNGEIQDVAVTLLKIMQISKPVEMTGKCLMY